MMTAPLYLGIDIGSSAVKAALFDASGRQLSVSRVDCQSNAEFAPDRWWSATVEALSRLEHREVVAIGICGRGGTNVLLDLEGNVIAPSWSDRRAHEEHSQLRNEHPELGGAALGLLSKARWWQSQHGPVAAALTAKDYVTSRLTGCLTSDPASGGAPGPGFEPLLPACPPWSLAGHVMTEASSETGLPTGTAVAVGWHDGAAAAFGAGASADATAAITLGTNAVYRVVTSSIPDGRPRYWDLTPGLTVSGGDISAAGTAMAWARDLWPHASIDRSQPGANRASFLPQLNGRIAPDVNRDARGGFAGLDGTQSPDDMLRAAAEGIAYSLRQVRDWLADGGLRATRSIATGGGAHDAAMAQLIADVLGDPLHVARAEEGCRGGALLGAVAAGHIDLETARTQKPEYDTYQPDATTKPAYDAAYERFLRVQRVLDGV